MTLLALASIISAPISILAFILAGFCLVWAYNLSFAAHMAQEEKNMMNYHYASFLVTLLAVVFIAIGVLIV